MARRSAAATADTMGPAPTRVAALLGAMKQVASAAMVVACLVAVVWVYLTVDNFLVTDSRFFLPGPPEPGERIDTFQIEGIRNVTDEQIIQVFGRDFGRSIFLCPIRERRLKLLGIDWVKEASIQPPVAEPACHSRQGKNSSGVRADARRGWRPHADAGGCRGSAAGSATCPGLSAFLCSPASHDPKARRAAASA